MTIVLAIVAALVVGFLAFRFIAGMVKWVLILGVVVFAAIIAHQAGAF
jgi:hypothetical protein